MGPNEGIREIVDRLIDPDSDTSNSLVELEISTNADGLSLQELSTLLGLVFEPTVSSMVRNRLLTKCLVPRGDYLIPPDVFLRVLGSIGAPEIYYHNGKQHKSKRFSLPTQQKLLQWTISTLPFFGQDIYRILRRSLPILFGLLPYEFSRPYIATLIIVGTRPITDLLNSPSSKKDLQSRKKHPLKVWHVKLVADLLDRFPLDPSLKALILHFSRCESSVDIQQFLKSTQLPSSTLSADGIAIPDHEFPAILRIKEQRDEQYSEEILQVQENLLRVYKEFERSTKKRKIEAGLISKLDLFNSQSNGHQIPISSVNSVSTLISNLENISFINPSSVFSKNRSSNHRFRCLYVSLVLLNANTSNPIYKKLSTALKHHILSSQPISGVHNNFSIESFARYGTLFPFKAEIENFVETMNENGASSLKKQVHIMPYLHLSKPELLGPFFLRVFSDIHEMLQNNKPNGQVVQIMTILSLLIKKIDNLKIGELLEKIIPKIFDIMEAFWSRLDLLEKLSSLLFINAAISLATEKSSVWANTGCMVPPPSLMFKLVVSTNPLIVSEALGYIACIKKLKLLDNNSSKIAWKNAYVMDSINFLWREMAFKYEKGTINMGMYLHPHYLQRLNGLDFFSNSSLISTRSVGGIVQNPAFAYLCAEIVWKLEDMDPNITTRHPGPISEASVASLQQDSDVTWLQVSYQDLRVSLLNHLDAMGFHGLADLLFTSLKPLVNQRTRNEDMT